MVRATVKVLAMLELDLNCLHDYTVQYPPKKLRHLQNSMRHFPDLQRRYTLLSVQVFAVYLYMKGWPFIGNFSSCHHGHYS
jgi:hypothetical protein